MTMSEADNIMRDLKQGTKLQLQLSDLLKLPIAPRAKNYGGLLGEVLDKIKSCPNQLCWRCKLNIDSRCTAYLHVGSEQDQEYRRDGIPLCEHLERGETK